MFRPKPSSGCDTGVRFFCFSFQFSVICDLLESASRSRRCCCHLAYETCPEVDFSFHRIITLAGRARWSCRVPGESFFDRTECPRSGSIGWQPPVRRTNRCHGAENFIPEGKTCSLHGLGPGFASLLAVWKCVNSSAAERCCSLSVGVIETNRERERERRKKQLTCERIKQRYEAAAAVNRLVKHKKRSRCAVEDFHHFRLL